MRIWVETVNNQTHETANPLVSQLVGLLDHALEETANDYGTQHWHSLLWNLHNLRTENWDAPPLSGKRTIRDIVNHFGIVFLAYENHVFGDGSREWDDPSIDGERPGSSPEEVIGWLCQAHARFRTSVANLTDSQLGGLSPWGDPWT